MKFLTPFFSIVFFLCYSSIAYGQSFNQVIIELDEVFFHANYNQYALPVAYESATAVSSINLSLNFNTSKIQINEVVVSPEGNGYAFNVNYDFPNPNRLQTAA